jgi:hypothetical protein
MERTQAHRWPGIACAWLAAFPLLFHSSAYAAALQLACPISIAEKSIQLVNTPEGWTTFTGSPLYLHGAAPMDGPPAHLGELSDYTETRKGEQQSYTYQLRGKFPDGKWLSCTYGESDQVTLARRLPDDTNVCVVTSRKGKHVGQNDIKIDCK